MVLEAIKKKWGELWKRIAADVGIVLFILVIVVGFFSLEATQNDLRHETAARRRENVKTVCNSLNKVYTLFRDVIGAEPLIITVPEGSDAALVEAIEKSNQRSVAQYDLITSKTRELDCKTFGTNGE